MQPQRRILIRCLWLPPLSFRRCGDSWYWIFPPRPEPGENSNLQQLQLQRLVSVEQRGSSPSPRMLLKPVLVSLSSLFRSKCGEIQDWIVPPRLYPGENRNLQQLHPRKSVSAEQMVLFDIGNGHLGFFESSYEYQELRCQLGNTSLAMGFISTVDILECDEEGGDKGRGHMRVVVILHISFIWLSDRWGITWHQGGHKILIIRSSR